MRTLPRATLFILTGLFALVVTMPRASAQTSAYYPHYNPYLANQTVHYGLNLPSIPTPNGQDEVRAADGTTCRSSTSNAGAYLDVGGLGHTQPDGQFGAGSLYGRIIIPLGDKINRIDCTKLYRLEISRLRHELRLIKMGMGAAPAGPSGPAVANAAQLQPAAAPAAAWDRQGWSRQGQANLGARAKPQIRSWYSQHVPQTTRPRPVVGTVHAAGRAARPAAIPPLPVRRPAARNKAAVLPTHPFSPAWFRTAFNRD